MVLLTKDYVLVGPDGVKDEKTKEAADVWHLEAHDLIALLSEVCPCLSELMLDPDCSSGMAETYDLAQLMQGLLERYILQDFFGLANLAASKKIEEFKAVTKLVEELVWLTNNIIIEECNSRKLAIDDKNKKESLVILHGLDQTYIRLMSGFAAFDNEHREGSNSDEPILSTQFWDVMAWGMQLLAQFLKTKDAIVAMVEKDAAAIQQRDMPEDERTEALQSLAGAANSYFLPYLIFARDFLDRILENKEAGLKKLTDKGAIEALNKSIDATKADLCQFLSLVVKCLDEETIIQAVFRPSVEDMVFSLFQTFQPASVVACNTIIGQFIALHEDDFSEKYIKERGLLGILAKILEKGSLEMRKEALWMLQNIACGPKSADLTLRSSTDVFQKILTQLRRPQAGPRAEAALCLANIFAHAKIDEAAIAILHKADLFAVINELLTTLQTHEMTIIALLEVLGTSFRTGAVGVAEYVQAFGADAVELHMYSRFKSVTAAAHRLATEFFETEEMEVDEPVSNHFDDLPALKLGGFENQIPPPKPSTGQYEI
jgi:hypothetical protein